MLVIRMCRKHLGYATCLYFYLSYMQEIKLFGRYVIRPDNGKTWAVSDILTNKKEESKNIGEEYEGNTRYPRDLLAALLMVRERELRKKDMETLDDYIKVIKEIDSTIVSELTSLLK